MNSTFTIFYDQIFDTSKDVVATVDFAGLKNSTLYSTPSAAYLSGGMVVGFLPYYRVAPDNYSTADGLGYSPSSTVSAASGILDVQVGVGFDFSGTLASLSGEPNALTIIGRAQDNYPVLFTTGNMLSASAPFMLSDGTLKRVRVRLAEFGTRLVVDCKGATDRIFTNYADIELGYATTPYCRLYFAFTNCDNATSIAVKNININAYDTTLSYVLSSADYMGQSPMPVTFNEGDTISSIQNVNDTSGIVDLGTLITISNESSGAPYVGSEFISVIYQ